MVVIVVLAICVQWSLGFTSRNSWTRVCYVIAGVQQLKRSWTCLNVSWRKSWKQKRKNSENCRRFVFHITLYWSGLKLYCLKLTAKWRQNLKCVFALTFVENDVLTCMFDW